MKKYFLIGLTLQLNFIVVIAQNYKIEYAPWTDSLRKFLVLDSVYCRDSVVHFEAYDTTFQLNITRKRPDFNKAKELIDSISLHLENDTTFARLVTVLNEFDNKYRIEFVYTIDYFQDLYHKSVRKKQKNAINELDLIEKMENVLYLNKALRDSSFSIIKFLLNRDSNLSSYLEPYTTTWERWGRLNLEIFLNYYKDNQNKFDNELKLVLREDLEINEFYGICYTFDLFNRKDSNLINCNRLERLIDKKTSVNFLKALDNLNQKFHNNSCINELFDRL